ncbi:hypothetical protein HAX54_014145 [Datura stramonium]|uniref:Uncharacterized protein n=1 Tax=Datura stramonium TaxID=4076 RepID=A0ABS8TP63_DATST|nr:hypothetical protein [Datura stramonium]
MTPWSSTWTLWFIVAYIPVSGIQITIINEVTEIRYPQLNTKIKNHSKGRGVYSTIDGFVYFLAKNGVTLDSSLTHNLQFANKYSSTSFTKDDAVRRTSPSETPAGLLSWTVGAQKQIQTQIILH